jgi:MoaA/NifB/PqqE/SkfB family radical SAM enzyme
MLDSIKGFHIEPTNICTLKCPRCPRTTFIEQFGNKWGNQQINLTHFKKFFDIDLTDKEFLLCGNYGDPIYYNELFPMIAWIKEQKARVSIVTNGSYKKINWWKQLVSLLDERDHLTFSIDGTPDNFTNYRINADWKSIRDGIQVAANSSVNTTWKYITFSFNEHTIEEARLLSTEYGIKNFMVVNSDRWLGESDPFKPKTVIGPRQEVIMQWKPEKKSQISPLCKISNAEHFISANGFYSPCCYSAEYHFYYASEFYKNKQMYDISNISLSRILETTQPFYNNIETTQPKYCSFNCSTL